MDKIPQKIRNNIEKITLLKTKISNWEKLKHDELFLLLKEFEKTPRLEVLNYYNVLFNDSVFSETLSKIYSRYKDDDKLVILIISSLGNMIERYALPETDDVYSVMIENSERKNVGVYVAIFLPKMKLFENYQDKWKYFIKIKDLSPKKIAESSFEAVVDLYFNSIPNEYKDDVKNYYLSRAKVANNEYGKKYYLELAEKV